jgi:hypothetical protein
LTGLSDCTIVLVRHDQSTAVAAARGPVRAHRGAGDTSDGPRRAPVRVSDP